MNGKIEMVAHISIEGANEFFAELRNRISEYESKGLVVEVQYNTCMQPNGIALFSAVILGRKKAIK